LRRQGQGQQQRNRQADTHHCGHEAHMGRKMVALNSQQLSAST
jgi:hypothetical protein